MERVFQFVRMQLHHFITLIRQLRVVLQIVQIITLKMIIWVFVSKSVVAQTITMRINQREHAFNIVIVLSIHIETILQCPVFHNALMGCMGTILIQVKKYV